MITVDTCLRLLTLLCDVLDHPAGLSESLERVGQITCALMETQQTVILLRDEERHELMVEMRAGLESPALRPGHPLGVSSRLKRILWRLRGLHQIGSIEAGIEGIGFPILVAPLKVKGERIGLLLTAKPVAGSDSFSANRRRLYRLTASLASLLIENSKVYDYLRQQFAQRSQELLDANRHAAHGPPDETERLMVTSLNNPSKVARLLAVSFYKELARAGFSPNHIITAAAEILDCVTHETAGHHGAPPAPAAGGRRQDSGKAEKKPPVGD
ncbi:MAG: hypothetical protein WC708_04345 [Lentisphaeria bacterium]